MKHTYTSRARQFAGLLSLALCGLGHGAQAQATVPNKALQLDGNSKYGSTPSLNLSGTALTMECWMRANSFKSAFPFISSIIGIEATGSTALLRTGDEFQPANQLQFVIETGVGQQKLNSPTVLTTGTWYHVAATYDGASMKIYINGVLDASQPTTGAIVANDVFNFGRNYADSRILDGAIDEVRVWTRVLPATEILANRCQVGATRTGLQGLWRLDEGTGTTAVDQSGNSNTATLTAVTNTDWISSSPTLCARPAGTAAANAVSGLQVLPTENPITGNRAELEIRGAAGQAIALQVLNTLGQVVATQTVKAATAAERLALTLPQAAGIYVVRASTPAGTATAKLLKQ